MAKNKKVKNYSKNKKIPNFDIGIGQTLETFDKFLPHNPNRSFENKTRPVIIVDKNNNDEFVVIPGSTKKTNNTTSYFKHGIKYYRHNIEIEDDIGNPIKLNNKFQYNNRCTKLPLSEAQKIKEHVIYHTKFSSENKKKYQKFFDRNKKNRD